MGSYLACSAPIFALALAGALAAAPEAPSSEPGQQRLPKPRPGPEVLVVSDVFAEDPAAILPQPSQPVYYVILDLMEHAMGSAVAGEKIPPKEEVERQVVSILAERGFVRTEIGGPMPSIVILVAYGPANALTAEFEDADPETGAISSTTVFFNQQEIANLVGALKARSRPIPGHETAEIDAAANEDRLYVLVAALDATQLQQHKKQLVWRTFMSVRSARNSLPKCLGLMLASGSPHFARDTEFPIFSDDVDRRKATVEMGETEVIGIEEPGVATPAPERRK